MAVLYECAAAKRPVLTLFGPGSRSLVLLLCDRAPARWLQRHREHRGLSRRGDRLPHRLPHPLPRELVHPPPPSESQILDPCPGSRSIGSLWDFPIRVPQTQCSGPGAPRRFVLFPQITRDSAILRGLLKLNEEAVCRGAWTRVTIDRVWLLPWQIRS